MGSAVLFILLMRALRIQQGKWAFCVYLSQINLLSAKEEAQDSHTYRHMDHAPSREKLQDAATSDGALGDDGD